MQCQRHIVISILAAVFTTTPSWAQSTSTLLQKGIFTEETVGDLDAAIKIYEEIVADAEKNRAYAAQAQYRIGMCNLKQGRNDRAVGAFQKLIEQFPKQNELVAQANARLLKLGYAPGRTTPAEMTVRRVWEGSGVDTLGGPSLDGRYLSFVDWSTGDVAIRDLATGESRRLTNNKSYRGEPVAPRFSPDGTQVAYGWFNYEDFSHDLRVIGIEDSEPRVLYANEEVIYIIPTAWSPDGKHILANFQRKDRTAQIVLVSIADGSVQVLKSLDWRYPLNMSFSPDGRYIVYDVPTKEDDPNHDIFLLATDGSREIALIEHSASDANAAWAPDGKTVVFLSNRTGSMGVWAIQVANGKPVGIPRLVKQGIAERSKLMGFTRDGSLYYGHNAFMNVGEVYTATLDIPAGKVVVQPTPASDRFVGSNTASDWSPDGQYLAFVSKRGHRSKVIVIRSVETGEEREIPLTVGRFVTRPRWSPDGGSFLVEGSHKKDEGLYRIDAQTGDITRIVRGEPGTSNISRWAWSPDGEAIFFHRIDRSSKVQTIVRRELETGKEQIIDSSAMMPRIRDLTLSPDGRQLALIRYDSKPGMSITVMPARGGEPHEILRVKEPEFIGGGFWREGLAWTPDGRYLLFGKAHGDVKGQTVELWRVPVEGGEPQRLGVAMDNVRDVRVHPDGRRISFTAGKIGAEVWKMENFLPELSAAK